METKQKEDLWSSALSRLSQEDRQKVVLEGQNQLSVLSQLHTLTDTAKDQCIKKGWRLNRHNGETIILRDLFSNIAVWINVFKKIRDNAIQYDP